MIYDKKGRIKKLNFSNTIYTGHSVCNICKKDMPVCWDVVCYSCHKTFCHDCSKVYNGYWFCLDCYPGIIIFKNIRVKIILFFRKILNIFKSEIIE